MGSPSVHGPCFDLPSQEEKCTLSANTLINPIWSSHGIWMGPAQPTVHLCSGASETITRAQEGTEIPGESQYRGKHPENDKKHENRRVLVSQ